MFIDVLVLTGDSTVHKFELLFLLKMY